MTMAAAAQHPPATPRYILRGHASPIHALHFFAENSRLVSADADGWVVIWNVVTKRPRVVWKAHEGAVLEVKGFCFCESGEEMEVFTHGRDHKLRVWRITSADEERLDKSLPVERSSKSSSATTTAQPWLVHSLAVNALNFCAFSLCFVPEAVGSSTCIQEGRDDVDQSSEKKDQEIATEVNASSSSLMNQRKQRDPLLLAVPNALNSGAIDIFHLPSERRVSTIPADASVQTGMVMAVNIFLSSQGGELYVLSGYEDGHVMVYTTSDHTNGPLSSSVPWRWEKLYASRPHTQPVLSLDVSPGKEKGNYFLTSSADALIVKHPIPQVARSGSKAKGKQKEEETKEEQKTPLKVLNTKHAGQQGLRVRSDSKIFATAGWDARVRVYSCKTMKELAVLKWHKEGCYSVAFAEILEEEEDREGGVSSSTTASTSSDGRDNEDFLDLTAPPPVTGLKAVQQQRSQKAQQTHWLAAGSKDGKISLWDIY
ncbi:hypothetical protein VTN77DRAFT_2415 [Rasamsonia byssochlamydoides]|uniref:uncharacterized protein n=1 Tax=Rasamsonia byssochlamydoides TaxID=89139 RepID=UPI003743925F